MYWLALIALPLPFIAWWRARAAVEHTSLTSAWVWGIVALLAWAATVLGSHQSQRWLDYAAYGSVILLFTPFIAVLGARRPRTGAWNWFVVLPLIVVLSWAAVRSVITGELHEGFELPTPILIGCVLVLTMSLGNFFGTWLTLPVMITAASMAVMLRSLYQSASFRSPEVHEAVQFASIGFALAAAVFLRRFSATRSFEYLGRDSSFVERIDATWNDFCALYGTAWTKRVCDRLNQFAESERWPMRFIVLDGVREISADGGNNASHSLIEQRVRWVLKRFVDDEWLDSRLGSTVIRGEGDTCNSLEAT